MTKVITIVINRLVVPTSTWYGATMIVIINSTVSTGLPHLYFFPFYDGVVQIAHFVLSRVSKS
jgi:hypothetical protein